MQGLTEGAQHNDLHLQLAQALAVARVGLQLLQVLPHVQGYRQACVRAQGGRLCTAVNASERHLANLSYPF